MYSKKALSRDARFTVENETLIGSHCSNDATLAAYLNSKASNDTCDDFVSNVSLVHCSLGPTSAAALGRALRKNSFLKELRLAHATASSKSSRSASSQKNSSAKNLRRDAQSSLGASAVWATVFSGAAKSGEESGLATVVVNHSKLRDSDAAAISACFRGGGHTASSSTSNTMRRRQHASQRRLGADACNEEGSEDDDEDFEMGGELSSRESGDSNSDIDDEETLGLTPPSMGAESSEVRRHAMRLGLPSSSSIEKEGEKSVRATRGASATGIFPRHNTSERGHRIAVGLHFGKAWHAPALPAVGIGRPPLLRLHLAHNAIGDEGCIALARALKLSPCCDVANNHVSENGGGDEEDEEADCGWGGAPCLRELVLEENRIGDQGAAALAAAMGGCSYYNDDSNDSDRNRSNGGSIIHTSEKKTATTKRRRAGGGCPACNPRPSLLLASGRERRRGLEVSKELCAVAVILFLYWCFALI